MSYAVTRDAKKRKTNVKIAPRQPDDLDQLRSDIKCDLQELYQTQYQEHEELANSLQQVIQLVKKQNTEIQKLKKLILSNSSPLAPAPPAAPAPQISTNYASSRPNFREECSYIN